ncbi:hypothetical protein BJF81_13500 [Ornithinimicrobium sp. CNJ-824]|uniref:hypothetical protein n=1 Tax=Ornithinimicrobium sp. CNJ-824 TaxID=1904966 RepID=UPI0009611F30|nr:hypothetical protein [Ornithinimicrobium sp. CNJ-824]OLT22139.1 hypothetical protein BJF81_13500 [Ornithinimicrobium sp. CNJ-824]
MTSLSDRYVHAVVRRLPAEERAHVGQELRSTIGERVRARTGPDPGEVERDVLVELGDPERLAATYAGRELHLIGPAVYPLWRRVLLLLLSFVPAVVALITILATVIDGERNPFVIVGEGLGTALMTAVQVTFWVTLGFAIAERNEQARPGLEGMERGFAWNPDRLPSEAERDIPRSESIAGLVFASVAGMLVAFGPNPTIPVGDERVPLFTETAYAGRWMLVVLTLAWAAVEVLKLYRGYWSWPAAWFNVAQNAALVALVAWWVYADGLVSERLLQAVPAGDPQLWRTILVVVVAVIATWDSAESVWKARAHEQAVAGG